MSEPARARLRPPFDLSDVPSKGNARTNLSVYSKAEVDSAIAASQALALLKANNLSDLANVATARSNIGLGNVDNTSDANKPVSTAQQTALNLKANLSGASFTGDSNITKASPTFYLYATSGTGEYSNRTGSRYDAWRNTSSGMDFIYDTTGTPKTLRFDGATLSVQSDALVSRGASETLTGAKVFTSTIETRNALAITFARPSYALWQAVHGTANTMTGWGMLQATAGVYALWIADATRNVGIGTVDPAYKLDVTGDIRFTGGLYQGSNQMVNGSGEPVTRVYTLGSVPTSSVDGSMVAVQQSTTTFWFYVSFFGVWRKVTLT